MAINLGFRIVPTMLPVSSIGSISSIESHASRENYFQSAVANAI